MKKLKACLLLILVTCTFTISAFSQQPPSDGKYQLKDSLNIKEKNKMRQWSYEQNLSPFPAPRKSNWTLGLQKGYSFITGDIRSERGLGFGLNVRVPIGHVVSIRAQSSYCTAKGLNWKPNQYAIIKNTSLNGVNDSTLNYVGLNQYYYFNYKMSLFDFNVQGVINLNNIHFYNKESKFGAFAFAGVGVMLYKTMIDALDENGAEYDYNSIATPFSRDDRKDALNSLHTLLDGEYETAGENYYSNRSLFNRVMVPTVSLGAGISYRISRRVDLTLEHRALWVTDDLLDGQHWEETQTLTANADMHQWTTVGINLQLGKGEESAWWTNPLRKPYEEIRTLKVMNQKSTKDSDGDGVVDANDKEAATPKGARVDVMGVAMDSDEDGIQDFRDKQPFSPKGAKVDKEGFALDTDTDGVPDIFDQEPSTVAGAQVDVRGKTIIGGTGKTNVGELDMSSSDADFLLPMVNFDLGKSELKQEFYPSLYYVARLMLRHPNVKMKVTGHTDVRGESSANVELSKKRAQNVVEFLVGNFGISKDRFLQEGMSSTAPLIKDVPKAGDNKAEGFHYLNRRVEFQMVIEKK